jgi:hypothetical protein
MFEVFDIEEGEVTEGVSDYKTLFDKIRALQDNPVDLCARFADRGSPWWLLQPPHRSLPVGKRDRTIPDKAASCSTEQGIHAELKEESIYSMGPGREKHPLPAVPALRLSSPATC